MKIAVLIARVLLGLEFVVFGLNGLHPFIPAPPIPGPAGQFAGIMMASHYQQAVALVQVIGGLLLLSGQFLPLGLVLLGPVLVNILLFHALLMPAGILTGLISTVLWFVVFWGVRSAFSGIFAQKVPVA